MLRVARRIGEQLGVTVRTTYLAAHALPTEFTGNPDGYIDAAVQWLPQLHAEGLVDAVDAFCEGIGFTPAQTRRMFEAARALGVRSSCTPTSSATWAAARWRRRSMVCPPITSSTPASTACARWPGTARSPCCCPAPSTCCAKPSCRRWTRSANTASRWPWPPIAIPAHRRCCRCVRRCNWPARISGSRRKRPCAEPRRTPPARSVSMTAAHCASALRADFVRWNLRHPSELCYWLGGQLAHGVFAGGRAGGLITPLPSNTPGENACAFRLPPACPC